MHSGNRVRAALVGIGAMLLLVGILILGRSCERPTVATAGAIHLPEDLARDFDAAGIVAWCRKEIRSCEVKPIVRGAHGALWAREGNAWDRVLLAVAALEAEKVEARIVPGEPPRLTWNEGKWRTTRLDLEEAASESGEPPAGSLTAAELFAKKPELFAIVEATLVLEGDGAPRRISATAEPVASWIAHPPTIVCVSKGYELRRDGKVLAESGALEGAKRASLELKVGAETLERELFDRANADPKIPGHAAPRIGDVYTVVVAGGPLLKWACLPRGRLDAQAPDLERRLRLMGTGYFVAGDDRSRALAKSTGALVTWDEPRFVIASAEEADPLPLVALDVLADRVNANGDSSRTFHVARGLACDMLETRAVHDATGAMVVSATSVFSKYASRTPETPERRIEVLAAEGRRLLAEEPVGTTVRVGPQEVGLGISTSRGYVHPEGTPDLVIKRVPDGLAVSGGKGFVARSFGRDALAMAGAIENHLGGVVTKRLDYVLAGWVDHHITHDRVPLVDRTVLTYKAKRDGKDATIAVLVSIHDGKCAGTWVDMDDPSKHGEVKPGAPIESFLEPKDGKQIVRKEGLVSVSPTLHGTVIDEFTGIPIPGADVRLLDGRGSVRSAIDGTFAISDAPRLFPRVIFICDRSCKMLRVLDWHAEGPADYTKNDKTRIIALREAMKEMLASVPGGMEMALWSFGCGDMEYPSPNPAGTDKIREEVNFTRERDKIQEVVDKFYCEGFTPLTGAVNKVMEHLDANPASRDAAVILLTTGANMCAKPDLVHAWRAGKHNIPIHVIAFSLEPGGSAERDLHALARVSGGSFRAADDPKSLAVTFAALSKRIESHNVGVSAPGYDPVVVHPGAPDLGSVTLRPACTPGLLTVEKATVGRLRFCRDLSPKARAMIERRVADGRFKVTIPYSPAAIGSITAFGWFETEIATGRMTGRTEDGLHGALADPANFPDILRIHNKLPFVAWFHGISAYTTGSVLGAMKWTEEPSFLSGNSDDFMKFVQMHALEFCAAWWEEVGSEAFPENLLSYWSGVCLNFALQSMALPSGGSEACMRAWARAICRMIEKEITDRPGELAGGFRDDMWGEDDKEEKKPDGPDEEEDEEESEPLGDQFESLVMDELEEMSEAERQAMMDRIKQKYGPIWEALTGTTKGLGLSDLAEEFNEEWENGVKMGMGCDRLNPKR